MTNKEAHWVSLSEKHGVLVKQSDEAHAYFNKLSDSETGRVILAECGMLQGSIEETFNPLPIDDKGQLLVDPRPILVAKRD